MAQINPPKSLTPAQSSDFGDDAALRVSRSQEFFEDNRNVIIGVIAALVLLAVAIVAWRTWQANRSTEAQELLGAILTEYEAGNYQAALDGTDTAPGLLEIADEYGSTSTGEQATFFAADALYQLGETDRALEMFEDYGGSGLIGASALAGQAAIAEQNGDAATAAGLYERAATAFESPASTPGYLLDAARAFIAAGEADEASAALTSIVDDWAGTPEASTAAVELGAARAAATATGEATGDVTPAPVVADTTATESTDNTLTVDDLQ
ncbi:tetratricopeptide repeat protein [Rubrivirga sp.]|uniref:tetratricopeptide repeat protein n=1 Tax=Rubrivirga sp. TaxID=1885344 RepID=UPI003C794378